MGVSGGATVRAGPMDLSIAYQHTFWWALDNGGNGSIYALAGTSASSCGTNAANPNYGAPGCYRSFQAVNGGVLTNSLNEVGFSATARF
jgi:hypothetical protein